MNKSLPNRPSNVTPPDWDAAIQHIVAVAYDSTNVREEIIEHVNGILGLDVPDPLLLEVADELRVIKSAIRAGAIISNRIADEKDGQRRIRALHVIVDNLLERIETGGNPNAVKSVG